MLCMSWALRAADSVEEGEDGDEWLEELEEDEDEDELKGLGMDGKDMIIKYVCLEDVSCVKRRR
jgi:hypothetical protein